MEFQHFVITQFNLKYFPQVTYDYDRWLAWTINRVGFFKQYCFPSMVGQSTNHFTWLLYLDIDTPQSVRDMLPDVTRYPHIHYIYIDGYPQFDERYVKDVQEMCPPGTEWVVTSRLDNDDSMHQDAIRTIQEHVKLRDEFMVSLCSGYVYDHNTKHLSHYYYPDCPFISLVENIGQKKNIKGIFYRLHREWSCLRFHLFKALREKSESVVFVHGQVLWMQVFHEGNVSNSFYRGVPVLGKRDLTPFGLSLESIPLGIGSFRHYRNYVFWKTYFRVLFYRLLKKS